MVSQKSRLNQFHEHILEADYRQSGRDFLELVREGAEPTPLGLDAFRAAAPFLNVPAHIMLKPDGDQRTVNYDHVILGMWRTARLSQFMPKGYRALPLAQAVWYMPQGLDIWSQVQCEFPGHYAREQEKCPEINLKGPINRFEDLPPLREGSFGERLETMLQSIVLGDKELAFQAFLGLAAEAASDDAKRRELEANVLFAAIIDLPGPRLIPQNIVNPCHKALRARAMIDLAKVVGWENAYPFFLVVIPDLATNPRNYDLFDTAHTYLVARFGKAYRDLRLTNTKPLTAQAIDRFVDVQLHGTHADVFAHVTDLLAAGTSLIAINDAAVLAAARLMARIDRVSFTAGFSATTHCFDYANVVGFWQRNYDHPHQMKAAYFAPYFVNDTVRLIERIPPNPADQFKSQAHEHAEFARNLSVDKLIGELSKACQAQNAPLATALVDSYLARSRDRKRLTSTLAFEASRWEGDPHLPRNAMSHHEEYANTSLPEPMRDEIFRSWARYLSGCHKRSPDWNCFQLYREVLAV